MEREADPLRPSQVRKTLQFLRPLFRMRHVVFHGRMGTMLVRASSLPLQVLNGQTVRATQGPRFRLPKVFLRTVQLVSLSSLFRHYFRPYFFYILYVHSHTFSHFTTNGTTQRIQVESGGSPLVQILRRLRPMERLRVLVRHLRHSSPRSPQSTMPFPHGLS